jgi:hypothetical protein
MSTPAVYRSGIGKDMLRNIFNSDQSMYPAPLAYERLKSWVAACPELSILYKTSTSGSADDEGTSAPDESFLVAGVIVVLPIKTRHWHDLLEGRLKETDIDPHSMFANTDAAESDVGLHIFHVEKFDAWNSSVGKFDGWQPFAEFSLADVVEVAETKGWQILGYSGN